MWKARTANFEGILYTASAPVNKILDLSWGKPPAEHRLFEGGSRKKVAGKEITQLFAQTTFWEKNNRIGTICFVVMPGCFVECCKMHMRSIPRSRF